jgi:hypothetical protein
MKRPVILFLCCLPLKDLFSREKFAHLPMAISEDGERQKSYLIQPLKKIWCMGRPILIWLYSTAMTASPSVAESCKGKERFGGRGLKEGWRLCKGHD